jgi:hypothetical protein
MSKNPITQNVRKRNTQPSRNGHTQAPKETSTEPLEIKPTLITQMLSDVKAKPVEWLIPGWLPIGKLTLLAGDGKCGKSTFLFYIAACLSRAADAFGLAYDAEPGETLLLTAEDDIEDTIKPRMVSLEADTSKIHCVRGIQAGKDQKTFVVDQTEILGQYLQEHPKIRLIIIDPIAAYIGGADDNSDPEVRQALQGLVDLAQKHRVAVIILKHTGKSDRKAFHKTLGSVAWRNLSRMVWFVCRDPETPEQIVLCHESNLTAPVKSRVFRLEGISDFRRNGLRQTLEFAHLDDAGREALLDQLYTIEWLGETDKTADDLTRASAHSGANKVEECVSWLRKRLGAFAWPDAVIQAEAETNGFKFASYKAAKANLKADGLQSTPKGSPDGRW